MRFFDYGQVSRVTDEVRARLIKRYRSPLDTPRIVPNILGGGHFEVWEEPAPEWLCGVVDNVLAHTRSLPDKGEVFANAIVLWCKSDLLNGPEKRAQAIDSLLRLKSPSGHLPKLRAISQLTGVECDFLSNEGKS